jgi:GT2 family glycosyltransferase
MWRVHAVILNYQTPEMVKECLTPLTADQECFFAGATVVDNASGDGSAEQIRRAITEQGASSWAQVIEATYNGGFAAGNNIGLQVAAQQFGSDYVLLLNSDTLVRPGAIDAMVERMAAEPDIGILGPRLEWRDGSPQISAFRYRNPVSELIAGAATRPITAALSRFVVAPDVSDRYCEADWVSYAAVMLRREMLEQVGLLDDGYFMYFEDIDHCRRAKQAGWRVVYDPRPRVVHLRGGSSTVKSASAARQRRPRYYYASRARYFKKFYGRAGFLLTNVLWHAGRLVSKAREVFGRPRHVCDKEWCDNWTEALVAIRPSTASLNDHPAVISQQSAGNRDSGNKPSGFQRGDRMHDSDSRPSHS